MVPHLNYDFSGFISVINDIKVKPSPKLLNELKSELNSFFKEAKCIKVLYTNNTDKLFFGMRVLPIIHSSQLDEILQTDDPIMITSYEIEIDSRLFDPRLNLSSQEILATILHEVGHMVKDSMPIEKTRRNIDVYLNKNGENLVLSDSVHYREILIYGIRDCINKVTSMFFIRDDDELEADQFVAAYGFDEHLETAFHKIMSSGFYVNKDVDNKLIVLTWVLRLYKDVKFRRIPALRMIRKCKTLTGSQLEKKDLENVAARLNRIDDDSLLESVIQEVKSGPHASMLSKFKYNGVRSLEDDLYEFNMRVRNVEDEYEALSILRQINTRLALIDDYVKTENLSDSEKKRWFDTMEKFQKIRETLSNKTVYRDSLAGAIIINYPEMRDQSKL